MRNFSQTILSLFFVLTALFYHPLYAEQKKITPSVGATNIDHSAWNLFLTRYIVKDSTGLNRFRYAEVSDASLQALEAYLDLLQDLNPQDYSRSAQKAYWINLYNAFTVYVILEEYPVQSILELGENASGPWDEKIITVAGQSLSLNDVEHNILRKDWSDPRIHFGVNCASVGCPNLLGKAYTADNVETLLSQAAQEFLNHPRGMRFDKGTLILSSIFDWFKQDFGASQAEVLRTLSQYVDGKEKEALLAYTGKISHQYDWALNE